MTTPTIPLSLAEADEADRIRQERTMFGNIERLVREGRAPSPSQTKFLVEMAARSLRPEPSPYMVEPGYYLARVSKGQDYGFAAAHPFYVVEVFKHGDGTLKVWQLGAEQAWPLDTFLWRASLVRPLVIPEIIPEINTYDRVADGLPPRAQERR